ncbi:phage holin family protein [Leucobacter chromiireducens]|uniref:phage holin family protein n=1 Tax=Leucobacter chromiireducens TaxID=283877 RepID=UPI000F635A1F|nr:phage holin family protein [Leucobacter chromiireducens]
MRFLFQVGAQLVLGAIALVVIHFALPGVTVHVTGFFVALGVFTLAHALLGPFVLNIAQRYAAPLAGGVGLVATVLALWVATLFGDGIEITGVDAWVLAPIIVWVITALGGWLFMALFVEKWLKRRATAKAIRAAG